MMGEMRTQDEELQELKRLIAEWNASRLDMFAISDPNEDLEYRGAMRFYFQDSGSKVATKCVRFTSMDSTDNVTKTLVEKFHPDMKMLSNPTYSLYEVHPNGESRKLRPDEYPLRIQLEWQNNDREGRFLLLSDADKIVHSNIFETSKNDKTVENVNLKRSLSRREKKQLKKKREEEAKKAAENKKAGKDDIATQLYDELPETSFTRSISNPEAVMRRRRQQKIEKRLKDFQSKDTAAGGTLKIFATTLKPEIPYKTLLVSVDDTTTHVIREALIKYQMEKENPEDYCLIMVNIPPEGHNTSATLGKERVVHDEDCPLKIAVTWPPSRGTVVFHLRRRANLPQHRQERRRSKSPARKPIDRSPEKGVGERLSQHSIPEHLLPYLLEIPSDGMDPSYKPRVHRLQMNVTEVGSEKSMSAGGNYLVLHAPHILQRHCVITNMDGRVSVTPSSGDAEVSVSGKRFYETTTLTHNDVVKIGRLHAFRFCDPAFEKPSRHSAPAGYHDDGSISSSSDMEAPRRVRPSSLGAPLQSSYNNHHPSNDYPSSHDNMDQDEQNPGMFETTFDVTGEVTTYTGRGRESELPLARTPPPRTPTQTSFAHEDLFDDKLPATLEFLETGEDAFFAAVVSEVNGQAVHFKLAPTYTLYMCSRFRMSPAYRPELNTHQRGERLGVTLLKIANMARSTIRDNNKYPGSLAFWMANCSELLHFIKQDRDISPYTKEGQPHGQQVLAQSVHQAFRDFVRCAQNELRTVMSAFIDPTDGADMEDSDLDSLHEKDSENLSEHSDGRSYHVYGPDGTLSGNDSWFGGRRSQGRATVSEVIYNLSSTMSLLRRCRVNAALTIQVFSQLFHFINTWLFNKLVLEPKLGLCTKDWGRRISKRLARVEKWAEKQGLELAADCHLCRIAQAAHLLQAPKNSASDVNAISSSCFKLNSLQVRTLLENYRPGPDEYIPQDLVESMVMAAEENADDVARSNGQEIQLEEDWELQLPFLLPEDGYSCEVIRGVPPGLKGFLEPLAKTGLCKLTLQPETSGLWTVYLKKYEKLSLDLSTTPQSPEIEVIAFNKGRGGMGLSIVAAKGTRQDELGIYIKQVVKDGPASKDGRLKAGDQILSVNGESLVGVTQERAAEVMVKSGANVSLRILKQGAIYHGLATLLIQSPTKESPQRLTPLEPDNDPPQSSPTLPDNNIPGYLPRHNSTSKQEERFIDDRRRSEVEERLKEEQRLREEQEERMREEERLREEEDLTEQDRLREDERLKEEKRREEEELLLDEERRREEERRIEEQRIRQEEEDRLYEERRKMEEEERAREEEERRLEEQRARDAERQRQIKLEEERKRREDEEDEKFRIQEDRIRKRMEEERRIIEEERRKLMEERRLLEEERKKEEERKRIEQQRLLDEQRRLEEEKKRIEDEKKRQMMDLEERRRAEEERRRLQEEEEEEEAQIIAEEQRRRQELLRREEFRRREDQRRIAEERQRAEEEARREANEPPKRRSRRIRFEDEVMPQVTTVEQQPPPQFNFQTEATAKKEEIVEEEPVVVRGKLTEADISNMNAVFEKLEEPKDEPPRSPIRVDTRNTRYGRAIVITQGMIPAAQSPSSPNKPSKSVYDFDQVNKDRQPQKPPEEPKESDFERWQRQQRELAERREREAEERSLQLQTESQREDREKREREEREREERERQQREERERIERERIERERIERERIERERIERERIERERIERERIERERIERERQREERERIERERQAEEQRLREERERRDQERRERMQRAKLERERREKEEQERQEREKQEAERKKKEQEEFERAEHERQLERQRKEQQALEEKNKQQDQHRERLDAEKERLRIIERERRLLYPDDSGSNKTLDHIEAMSEDEVEREFQRRLEAENKRRNDYEDRRASGLVSVTRVTYHPDRNDQSERDRRLQMILQEQRMLDKERNRRNVYEGERDDHKEVQRKLQQDREREQENWIKNQKERYDQNRREQERVALGKKTLENDDVNKKRSEVQLKREQDDELRRNFQAIREEEEKKLRDEHQEQRRKQQLDLERKLEEQNILREKENEARQQLQDEQRRRSGRANEPDHVMELKERALRDYERRRGLIDQEIARQQAHVKFQEEIRQKEMDDVKAKFDQQKPVSALKSTNGTKPKKQVSFSQMSTEFREPASPTYVVESSSGYTAKITPAASVRLVETRPPAIHTPPESPLSSPPDSPPESPRDYPPIPRPPPPEYDEYDPPPLPPPPSELLEDDDDFPPPPPPRSSFSDRSSSSSSDPRSPVDAQYNNAFSTNYPSNQRNAVASGYGTYPRAARPMSYPAPADLDSIQLSDSMKYSSSNNNIITMNSGIRETRSLGRIPAGGGVPQGNGPPPIPKKPDYMGFKDKMKLFNQNKTPENKVTTSRWQREKFGVNGDVTYT